jgi:GntR family transcriptional regulator
MEDAAGERRERVIGRDDIAAELLREIRAGAYGEAGLLPGEHKLAKRFGAARGTVRDALRKLRDLEEIDSQPRRGWYVTGDHRVEFPLRSIDHRHPGRDVWGTWLDAHGLIGESPTTVTVGDPPGHVRAHLGLDDNAQVTIRHRVRRVRNAHTGDMEPWSVSMAYWPLWLAEGTALMRTGSGPDVDLTDPSPLGIAEAKGYTVARNRDLITARPATDDEAMALHLPPGGTVLTVCRTSFGVDGSPFRVTHDIKDSARFRLVVED